MITIFRGPLVTSEKGRKPFLNPCPYMERFHSWWKMSACEKGLWLKCADIIWVGYSVLLQPVSTIQQQVAWRKFTWIEHCWIQSSASLTSSCSELNPERGRYRLWLSWTGDKQVLMCQCASVLGIHKTIYMRMIIYFDIRRTLPSECGNIKSLLRTMGLSLRLTVRQLSSWNPKSELWLII